MQEDDDCYFIASTVQYSTYHILLPSPRKLHSLTVKFDLRCESLKITGKYVNRKKENTKELWDTTFPPFSFSFLTLLR